MKELHNLCRWIQTRGQAFHTIVPVSSLPSPTFLSEGREVVSFSSNNYLGLATNARLIERAEHGLRQFGVGNCESRLLGGDLDVYRQLEGKLAALKHKEAAMLFATGYLTNLGVLSALVNSEKIGRFYGYRPAQRTRYAYFTDEFNHISIREGICMSQASKVTYRHCDMNDLENKLKTVDASCRIIVSDGVFSQDGDIVPLPDMLQLAERYDATVYIDDAHGTGVLGPTGGGTTEHFNVNSPRLICMGTLSKAYGAIGGFIATDRYIVDVLRLTCTAYGFTSTLPPDQACALCEAIDMVRDEPQRRRQLWDHQRYFVARMEEMGYRLLSRATPIVPVLIGDEGLCMQFSEQLARDGFHVDPIAFPAVAMGQSRLRFMMNANHTRRQIDRLLDVLAGLKDAQRAALSASYEKSSAA